MASPASKPPLKLSFLRRPIFADIGPQFSRVPRFHGGSLKSLGQWMFPNQIHIFLRSRDGTVFVVRFLGAMIGHNEDDRFL